MAALLLRPNKNDSTMIDVMTLDDSPPAFAVWTTINKYFFHNSDTSGNKITRELEKGKTVQVEIKYKQAL